MLNIQELKDEALRISDEQKLKFRGQVQDARREVQQTINTLRSTIKAATIAAISGIPEEEVEEKFTFEYLFPSLNVEDDMNVDADKYNEEKEAFNVMIEKYNQKATEQNENTYKYYKNYVERFGNENTN